MLGLFLPVLTLSLMPSFINPATAKAQGSEPVTSVALSNPVGVHFAQTPPADPPEDAPEDETCESKATFGFGFLLCGALRGLDGTIDTLDAGITKILDFDINSYKTDDVNSIQRAWSIIRNLTTVVLIIVMLVMVISQAVDWGPFDAYSLKRALPKLLIAVILIQVSWPLLIFVIDMVNAVGNGIGDLMYAPFGGPQEMTLKNLVGTDTYESSGGVFQSILLVGGLGVAAAALLFGFLTPVAFGAVVALIIGYFVLVLRQILIILSLIFAPLALAFWILPGTSKYWKLWYETFTKLLIMFPLIIAMIAAGRIFAKISTSSTLTDVDVGMFALWPGAVFGEVDASFGILKTLFIFVGFFAPFFLISKTFALGGQALGALANVANGASQGLSGKGRKALEGRRDRNRAERGTELYDPRKKKYSMQNLRARATSGKFTERGLQDSVIHHNEEESKRKAALASQAGAQTVKHGGRSADALVDLARNGDHEQKEAAIAQLIQNGEFGTLRDLMYDDKGKLRDDQEGTVEAYRAALGRDDRLYKAVHSSARDMVPQLMKMSREDAMQVAMYGDGDARTQAVLDRNGIEGGVGLNAMTAQEMLGSHHGFVRSLTTLDDDTQESARKVIDQFVALNPQAAAGLFGSKSELGDPKKNGGIGDGLAKLYAGHAVDTVDGPRTVKDYRELVDVKTKELYGRGTTPTASGGIPGGGYGSPGGVAPPPSDPLAGRPSASQEAKRRQQDRRKPY